MTNGRENLDPNKNLKNKLAWWSNLKAVQKQGIKILFIIYQYIYEMK